VDHFHHRGEGDVVIGKAGRSFAGGKAGEEDEHGAEHFAAEFADVGDEFIDVGEVGGEFTGEKFVDGTELGGDEFGEFRGGGGNGWGT